MTFVDTNYFLRFLLQDIEDQHREAKNLFLLAVESGEKLLSSTVVFFEVFWVLRSTYGKDKQILAATLDKLLKLNVEFSEHRILVESVKIFKKVNLSLEDCYNLVFARSRQVKSFKTFDKNLIKIFEGT